METSRYPLGSLLFFFPRVRHATGISVVLLQVGRERGFICSQPQQYAEGASSSLNSYVLNQNSVIILGRN